MAATCSTCLIFAHQFFLGHISGPKWVEDRKGRECLDSQMRCQSLSLLSSSTKIQFGGWGIKWTLFGSRNQPHGSLI